MKLEDIRLRDPYVYVDREKGRYYLYGTGGPNPRSFYAYVGNRNFDFNGPIKVFEAPEGFWAHDDFWAPELHFYQGAYYLFVTFGTDGKKRGCQALRAEDPLGPFSVYSEILTPEDEMALDGTLYLDPTGKPHLIYCHEWTQVRDGEICARPLSDDLRTAIGPSKILFKASMAPWSKAPKWFPSPIHVTDGPFVYQRGEDKALLWSTYGHDDYLIGVAYPHGGDFLSSYDIAPEPLPIVDGGHGMVFEDLDGIDRLIVHVNNSEAAKEHPGLFRIGFENGKVRLEGK